MTFCRFGFDEHLTLDDLRQLIDRKELAQHDLLLVGDSTDWKAARDIAELKGLFPAEKVERFIVPPETRLPPKPLPPLPQLVRRPYRPNPLVLIAIVIGAVMLFGQVLAILRSIFRGQAIDCGTIMTFFFWMMLTIVASSFLRAKL